jgi:hypothetical protein
MEIDPLIRLLRTMFEIVEYDIKKTKGDRIKSVEIRPYESNFNEYNANYYQINFNLPDNDCQISCWIEDKRYCLGMALKNKDGQKAQDYKTFKKLCSSLRQDYSDTLENLTKEDMTGIELLNEEIILTRL